MTKKRRKNSWISQPLQNYFCDMQKEYSFKILIQCNKFLTFLLLHLFVCACVCTLTCAYFLVTAYRWKSEGNVGGNQLSPSAILVQGNQIQVASLISKYLCLPSHLTGSQFTHINQAATMFPASNWVTCVVAETCSQEAKHTNRICEMKTPHHHHHHHRKCF